MTATQTIQHASLYDRLGGAPGIRGIVEDIVASHMDNPVIRSRFLPYREDPEKLETVKRHLCEFIAAGTGGSESYTGLSMPEVHRGMNISEQEYMAAVDDILAALDRNNVDQSSRQEVLAIVYSLRGEILRT